MAAFLIKEGADVNAKNKRKVSPLHESAYRGFIDLVELLIQKGAAINATDKVGDTYIRALRKPSVNNASLTPRSHTHDRMVGHHCTPRVDKATLE